MHESCTLTTKSYLSPLTSSDCIYLPHQHLSSSYPLHTHCSFLSPRFIVFTIYFCCSSFCLSYIFILRGFSLPCPESLMARHPGHLCYPLLVVLRFLSPVPLMIPITLKSHLGSAVCARVHPPLICQRHIQT